VRDRTPHAPGRSKGSCHLNEVLNRRLLGIGAEKSIAGAGVQYDV
jgi:hypothetical protein